MGLQYSITAIGSVMLQTAVNGLGTVYVTVVTAASKVSLFLCCPFDAMGCTMADHFKLLCIHKVPPFTKG